MATQAQVLFSACQSFYRALRVGVPGVHYSKGLRPLDVEIAAIQKAAGNIEFFFIFFFSRSN